MLAALCFHMSSCLGRYTRSVAFQAYKETGKMQFAEFGTPISLSKSMLGVVKEQLGWGQGDILYVHELNHPLLA